MCNAVASLFHWRSNFADRPAALSLVRPGGQFNGKKFTLLLCSGTFLQNAKLLAFENNQELHFQTLYHKKEKIFSLKGWVDLFPKEDFYETPSWLNWHPILLRCGADHLSVLCVGRKEGGKKKKKEEVQLTFWAKFVHQTLASLPTSFLPSSLFFQTTKQAATPSTVDTLRGAVFEQRNCSLWRTLQWDFPSAMLERYWLWT